MSICIAEVASALAILVRAKAEDTIASAAFITPSARPDHGVIGPPSTSSAYSHAYERVAPAMETRRLDKLVEGGQEKASSSAREAVIIAQEAAQKEEHHAAASCTIGRADVIDLTSRSRCPNNRSTPVRAVKDPRLAANDKPELLGPSIAAGKTQAPTCRRKAARLSYPLAP